MQDDRQMSESNFFQALLDNVEGGFFLSNKTGCGVLRQPGWQSDW